MKHPLRTFEYLLVPQLFRCVSLSAELTAAGLTKGIATKEKRTSYFDNRFHGVDYVMFAIGGVGMVVNHRGFNMKDVMEARNLTIRL